MDMSPGATNQPTGQKEFTLSQNRISTLLSAPSTNSNSGSRPGETRYRVIKNDILSKNNGVIYLKIAPPLIFYLNSALK